MSFVLALLVTLHCGESSIARAENQIVCKVPAGKPSNIAIDSKRVCLDADPAEAPDGEPIRLVGYGGITEITQNDRWRGDTGCNASCDPDANTCSSPVMTRTLATRQVDTTNPKTGANLTRVFAMGGSCNAAFSAENNICRGFGSRSEIMPFERLANGKFNVKFVNNSDPGVDGNLSRCWEARFRYFLKEAERNGIIIIISLFDENTITGIGNSTWLNNPWNPLNNNMGELLPTSRSGLPAFYNICPNMAALTGSSDKCADSALNRLGRIQKKYATKIVEAVEKSGARNVMFEVMNQARIEDYDADGSHGDAVVLAAWVNTVANWFTDYLWVAAVKKGQNQDMRRLLRECRSNTNCKDSNPSRTEGSGNPLLVFWRTGIDIIKPHFSIWAGQDQSGDICQVTDELFRFGKPVIMDDDGAPRDLSNNNRMVSNWASRLCGRTYGSIHFYHTKDGSKLQGKTAPVCEQPDTVYVDCMALDSLANNGVTSGSNQYVGPTQLCGKIVSGVDCPPKSRYCQECHGKSTFFNLYDGNQ
jgi:hypothetical protein